MEKFLRYAELFKGDSLRIVTSVFLLKIASIDLRFKGKIIQIIEGYGEIQK